MFEACFSFSTLPPSSSTYSEHFWNMEMLVRWQWLHQDISWVFSSYWCIQFWYSWQLFVLSCNGCYKYRLSHLHIHHRLCRKSPGTICRGILHIPQPVNHPTKVICTPCMIPEPIEGQDQQLDCIYPPPGCIYPLPLAHTIVLNHFNWVPMESLPNITSSHSNHSMQFPQLKPLPQSVSVTLDPAGHPPDHNSFSISFHSLLHHVRS